MSACLKLLNLMAEQVPLVLRHDSSITARKRSEDAISIESHIDGVVRSSSPRRYDLRWSLLEVWITSYLLLHYLVLLLDLRLGFRIIRKYSITLRIIYYLINHRIVTIRMYSIFDIYSMRRDENEYRSIILYNILKPYLGPLQVPRLADRQDPAPARLVLHLPGARLRFQSIYTDVVVVHWLWVEPRFITKRWSSRKEYWHDPESFWSISWELKRLYGII